MQRKLIQSSSATFDRPYSLTKTVLLSFALLFASPCRMLIEIFTRKDFGERYFRLSSAVGIFFVLAIYPLWNYFFGVRTVKTMAEFVSQAGLPPDPAVGPDDFGFLAYISDYFTWYMYLAAFLFLAIRHQRDMKHNPSVYDGAKYSLYCGRIHRAYREFLVNAYKKLFRGKVPDIRRIECWLEAAPFFLGGVLLHLGGESLGGLLIFSSVVYAMSYIATYKIGDNMVMDAIDERIVSKGMYRSFVEDADESETGYYRYVGRKPNDPEMRKKVVSDMLGEDEDDVPVAK